MVFSLTNTRNVQIKEANVSTFFLIEQILSGGMVLKGKLYTIRKILSSIYSAVRPSITLSISQLTFCPHEVIFPINLLSVKRYKNYPNVKGFSKHTKVSRKSTTRSMGISFWIPSTHVHIWTRLWTCLPRIVEQRQATPRNSRPTLNVAKPCQLLVQWEILSQSYQ